MGKILPVIVWGFFYFSTSTSLEAQLLSLSQQPERLELIVLLAAGEKALTPEEIVHRAEKNHLPSWLRIGHPDRVRPLISGRRRGLDHGKLDIDLDSATAKLQRYLVLSYPPGSNLTEIKARLSDDPRIEHVGPNRRAGISAVPNDPFYSSQWGLPALGLPAAWDRQNGQAYVAVVDIGIDTDHEDHAAFDAAGNWLGGNYRPFLSYDYGNGDANPDTGEPQLVSGQLVTPTIAGHGTHVAGILAAHTDNGVGVAGVCQKCSLMISKASYLTPGGGFSIDQADVVNALHGSIDRGAQVITLSLGWRPVPPSDPSWCGGEAAPDCAQDPNDSLCVAIGLANGRDVIMTAAAGNDGSPSPDFPANDPRVLGVAGTRSDGQLWNDCPSPACECGGSNYDPEQFNLPAVNIISTFFVGLPYAPGVCDDGDLAPAGDGYGPCTGTSMAAPHLAGIAAVLRSANPVLRKEDISDLLETHLSQQPGWNPGWGQGTPDTDAALEDALGRAAGQVLANRLTPLFELYSGDAETHLSTTVPQMAAAALTDSEVAYYTEPRVPLVAA